MTDHKALPWERYEGAPSGTGVCLSGGGLRAASYSFGVLQELQTRCGLLYSSQCADFLSVVSGGSYIGATYILGAAERSKRGEAGAEVPLLSEGSPEEAYVLTHADYLHRGWIRFLAFSAANVGIVLHLFIVMGILLAGAVLVGKLLLIGNWDGKLPSALLNAVPFWLAGPALVLCALYSTRRVAEDDDDRPIRGWRQALALIAEILLAPLAVQPLADYAAGNSPWWLLVAPTAGIVILAGIVVSVVVGRRVAIWRRVAAQLARAAPWMLRLALFYVCATVAVIYTVWWSGHAAWLPVDAGWWLGAVFAGNFLLLMVLEGLNDRISLHRDYRGRLASCFCVGREGGKARQVPDPPLSAMQPPPAGEGRFPRLLVCATAHISGRYRPSRSYVPFVFSYDFCGVPGGAATPLSTDRLELGRSRWTMWGANDEPLVSLFTAVATSGGAIAPSMGRYTRPTLRPLLTVLNLRLGKWLPNPFSSRMAKIVNTHAAAGEFKQRDKKFGSPYDELVLELFGFSGPQVYVSDGGHFDNLGLLTLLRARCARIVCVDAEPDNHGSADELRRVLAMAKDELGIDVTMDLSCFAVDPNGYCQDVAAEGHITYSDGSSASLRVIKLGMSSDAPEACQIARTADVRFPYHATKHQIYRRERMDAYRTLGRWAAGRALDKAGGRLENVPSGSRTASGMIDARV